MARAARKTSRTGEGRAQRIPLGQQQPKLARVARKGMVGRWINDVGGRIAHARQAGYEHVTESFGDEDEKRPVSQTVGVKDDGSPEIAFYMEIPKKLYDQDQKAKQQQVDLVDEAIRHGNIQGEVGKDGRYMPVQGVNVRTE